MALRVVWKQQIDTETIIRDIVPSAEDDMVRSYSKKIGRVWELFNVTYYDFNWRICRSHEEIQDFILAYNLKFKTKLTFASFKLNGIKDVCNNQEALNWSVLHLFLQTKDYQLGKEGSFRLLKKSGGRFKDFCCRLPWQWSQRNFIVTMAGVMYYTEPNKEIKEYMPFNSRMFAIFCGKVQTGYEFGIRLEASHRKLLLYAENCMTFFRFIYCIKETFKKLEGPESNPFESFAPPRKLNHIQFLIDGEQYFRAVCESLERAQWQIMICGWWVSPEFQLLRPLSKYPNKRLDTILQNAASKGVKIFILVYNQSSFLTNDSAYTKQILESLSSNIKVLQHPLGVLPTFWSHHQKAVIVDQSEVIMGGLDLCYGRYDTTQHLLHENDEDWYPGIQYNNIRNRDFLKVRQFWKSEISRNEPRLPWHDVGVRFTGEAVWDVCHHFIEYWNYASFQTHYEDRYVLILDKDKAKQPLMKRIKQGISNKIASIKHFAGGLKDRLFSSHEEEEKKKKKKKEQQTLKEDQIKVTFENHAGEMETEYNSNKGIIKTLHKKSEEKETHSARSPRFNAKSEEFKQRMLDYQNENSESRFEPPGSIRKTINQLDEMVEKMEDNIEKIDYIQGIRVTNTSKIPPIPEEEQFSCQVLRSVGGWSIGCDPTLREQSVYNAYLSLIQNSQNFIYIQNQFFISAINGSPVIKNQIANAIFNRIMAAHHQKKKFRVIIVLPLVPGFAGQLDDPEAVIPRVIMHWQYETIIRNQNSLLQRLRAKGVEPEDFISFFSLRTHGVIKHEKSYPTTEIVYLHSKLMIVDDRQVIIGSANINDRSMRGSRDSELCLFVEGKALVRMTIGDRVEDISQKIRKFRVKLWTEHFGQGIKYENPLDDCCIDQINRRAQNNTKILREVFHCYPDDNIPTFQVLSQWREKPVNQTLYEKFHSSIKGMVVNFPLWFLNDEDLLVGSTLYPDLLSV